MSIYVLVFFFITFLNFYYFLLFFFVNITFVFASCNFKEGTPCSLEQNSSYLKGSSSYWWSALWSVLSFSGISLAR